MEMKSLDRGQIVPVSAHVSLFPEERGAYHGAPRNTFEHTHTVWVGVSLDQATPVLNRHRYAPTSWDL